MSMEGDLPGLYNMKNIYYCIVGSDIPRNVDRDGIAKIEGVPEQAQGTTGPGTLSGFVIFINV